MSKRILNRIKEQLFFRTAVSDFNLAKKELTSVKDFSGRSLGLQRTSWGLDSWKMRPRFGSTSRKGSASTVTFSSALVILPGLKPGLSSQHMLTKPTNSQTWHPFLKNEVSGSNLGQWSSHSMFGASSNNATYRFLFSLVIDPAQVLLRLRKPFAFVQHSNRCCCWCAPRQSASRAF